MGGGTRHVENIEVGRFGTSPGAPPFAALVASGHETLPPSHTHYQFRVPVRRTAGRWLKPLSAGATLGMRSPRQASRRTEL
jgi:hypothetical protein